MDFREDEFDVFEKGDFMETIRNVEINQLHDFKNHPFKVEVNTELCELMKSIEKEGVLVPFYGVAIAFWRHISPIIMKHFPKLHSMPSVFSIQFNALCT